MNYRGLGLTPMGVGAFGYGSPATAPVMGGAVHRGDDGTIYGSRKISLDPETAGQYEFDDFGRAKGDRDVRQLAIIAMRTVLNSSALDGVGKRSSARVIGDDFAARVRGDITDAFARLVAAGMLRIDAIEVAEASLGRSHTVVRLTDLTNQKPFSLSVP